MHGCLHPDRYERSERAASGSDFPGGADEPRSEGGRGEGPSRLCGKKGVVVVNIGTLIRSAGTYRGARAAVPLESARVEAQGVGPGPRQVPAATLAGVKVVSRSDETLGSISEVILDLARGRIAYALLACGGFMGVGERLFAIPWNVLKRDTRRDCFVLDADDATLASAPAIDKDQWPSEPDLQWHQRLHEHYRARPYWE
jgi:PRC-barrel domain